MSVTACGLIVNSLEIGKALADRDRAVLYAKGMCMYPLMRSGDLLHIQSRNVEQVAVGDIAVCRNSGRLVCHRVVDKGVRNERPFIVTRSDRSRRNDDGFVYDENLLGVVTSIERGGRRINPCDNKSNGSFRFIMAIRRILSDLVHSSLAYIAAALSSLQRTAAYRSGSRLFRADSRHPLRFEVRVWKKSWRKLGLYMPLKPEEFDITRPAFQDSPVDCWTLALYLDSHSEPAAQATFQSGPGRWHLNDIQVRARYRGMELEKSLASRAEEIFRQNGITNFDLEGSGLE